MSTKRICAFIGAVAPAAALCGLAFTAAPAGASTGPVIATTNAAGYQASGRDFRFITSTLTIPDDSFASLYGGFYPEEYIQLSNGSLNESNSLLAPTGDQYVRAGIETCQVAQNIDSSFTCNGEWVAFVETYDSTLFTPLTFHFINLASVNQGDGVKFSIYYDQAGNELHFTITPPATGTQPEQFYKTQAYGPLFDHAAAVDDFVNSDGQAPIGLPPFVSPFQVNSFLQGALTTYNGTRGSFLGKWATSLVEATSNGLPWPSGTVRAVGHALYSDGLPGGKANDAFDVWAR